MSVSPKSSVPGVRVRATNDADARSDGSHVLYWMTAARRTRHNFGLQRAVDWARELKKPLVVLEAVRVGYRWASDRHHAFLLAGMADNQAALEKRGVAYHAYVEPKPDAGKGLLAALAKDACVVVADDWPCFFLPRMLAAASEQVPVRMEAVDSNGLLPIRAVDKAFARAYDLRRVMQRELGAHLQARPKADPLAGPRLEPHPGIPAAIQKRWPAASGDLLAGRGLDALPIDHDVAPVSWSGGPEAGARELKRFASNGLARYGQERGQVDVSSGLSGHLHYGHVGAHQVFDAVASAEDWSLDALGDPRETKGSREGWWGMSPGAEAFLDQIATWRELGLNMCAFQPGYERYDTLPDWALATLSEHASDERPYLYTLDQLDAAETHDDIWNAAQRQLVRDGRIENYLRMLWGKKVLHWTESPEQGYDVLVELNNRYAVDGRDPNSYTGIRWTFGAFDRPWGPERDVFGKVRYMTSDSTRRKLKLDAYLERWGPEGSLF